MAAAITAHEQELVVLCGGTSALFHTAAVDWLRHVEPVDGLKPSTLQGYRYRLTPPDTPARKQGPTRGRTHPAPVRRPSAAHDLGDASRTLSRC